MSRSIWVGAVGSLHVVHDPELELDSASWVALFTVVHGRLELYTRWYARRTARSIAEADDAHAYALNVYGQFKLHVSSSELEAVRVEARNRDAAFVARVESIEKRHHEHLAELTLPSQQVREPVRNERAGGRTCVACSKSVELGFSPVCVGCGWVVCGTCGACGCSAEADLLRRAANCWSCHGPLDSASDRTCSRCNWIACPTCRACGCGYRTAHRGD